MELSKKLQNLPEQFFAVLAKKVGDAINEGRDIINLGQGNPDQPTPPHIIEAMQQAVTDPTNHKYSPFLGLPSFRKEIANFYKREYNVDIDADTEIAILFGAKAGLVELPLAILNEGDYLLLPDPGYPDYLSSVAIANINYATMPLTRENHFLPDYTAIDNDILQKAKLLYLNYPNNPTGAVATEAFFEETVDFAKQHNITVMHDFAYGAIGFDHKRPRSFLQTPNAKEVGVEFYTLSKTYNMAGWRVGFAVGNKDIIRALNLLQDHLFCSIFPAIQQAATCALQSDQSLVAAQQQMYEARRNTLKQACDKIGWHIDVPAGSFFAWLPVPKNMTSEQFANILLEKANVAVAAGNGFGEHGEGYVRVGLLVSEARIEEAIARIGALQLF